ncbi:MAG: AAA family ATPase [Microthrixaceae bacterium]|nr:AAA family ATPase [Microthrixaceae bacterium]
MNFSEANFDSARQRRRERAAADWERATKSHRAMSLAELANALWCEEGDIPERFKASDPSRTAPRLPSIGSSNEELHQLWTSPAIEARREHRIAHPTGDDRTRALLAAFERCTHHRIFTYDEERDDPEFAYEQCWLDWGPESNMLVMFGRNGAGKSLIINEFVKHLLGRLGEEAEEAMTQITAELHLEPFEAEELLTELALGLNETEANFVSVVCAEMLRYPAFCWREMEASPLIARTAKTRSAVMAIKPSEISNGWVERLFHSALARFGSHIQPDWLETPRNEIPPVDSDSSFRPVERLFRHRATTGESFRLLPRVSRFEDPPDGIETELHRAVQNTVLGTSRWDDAFTYEPPVPDEFRQRLPDVRNGVWVAPDESFQFEWIGTDGHPCPPAQAISLAVAVSTDKGRESIADVGIEDRAGLQRLLDHLLVGGPGRYSGYATGLIAAVEGLLGTPVLAEETRSVWHSMGVELAFRARVLLKLTEIIANESSPSFVAEYARLVLQPPSPENTTVRAQLITPSGRTETLNDAPSGVARWTGLVIGVAHLQAADRWGAADAAGFQDLRDEEDPWGLPSVWAVARFLAQQAPPAARQPTLVLADEPELNLHPSAAEEAAEWIADLAADRNVLVATHSPAFLNLPPSSAKLVGVRRAPLSGHITPFEVDSDALQRLDALGDDLGLGRSAFLHLTKGVVVVEGQADAAALQALAPALINRHRLLVIALHGSSKARHFAESEVVQNLGLPMALLLDNTSKERLRRFQSGAVDGVSAETRTQARLSEIASTRDLPLVLLNFGAPDILAAIPEDTIRREVDGCAHWDWTERLAMWMRDSTNDTLNGVNFKNWVLAQWGRSARGGGLEAITSLFASMTETDEPPKVAALMLKELTAWADSIGRHSHHRV